MALFRPNFRRAKWLSAFNVSWQLDMKRFLMLNQMFSIAAVCGMVFSRQVKTPVQRKKKDENNFSFFQMVLANWQSYNSFANFLLIQIQLYSLRYTWGVACSNVPYVIFFEYTYSKVSVRKIKKQIVHKKRFLSFRGFLRSLIIFDLKFQSLLCNPFCLYYAMYAICTATNLEVTRSFFKALWFL